MLLEGKKGQIEFIIIIGLLVVALVGIFYVFQSGIISDVTTPQHIRDEQKLVKDFVVNIVNDATEETIRVLEKRGGYLLPDYMPGFTIFNRNPVAYWQQCGTYTLPDIKEHLNGGIEYYVKYALTTSNITDIYGKDTEFDLERITVSAVVSDNKVDVSVTLPVTVQEYLIREPYTTSVPTRFGRIVNFATDYSKEVADKRHWEIFTINNIMNQPNELPTSGLLTECGQVVFLSPQKISRSMENIVRDIVVNTNFWKPIQVDGNSRVLNYGIESVYNGKKYEDLDIEARLPQGFSVDIYEPLLIINSVESVAIHQLFPVSFCVNYFQQGYSVAYPVIIKVNDPLLNNNFYFASQVYVDNNDYGECGNIQQIALNCEETDHPVEIRVVGVDDQPLAEAKAAFGGCLVGESDGDGVIKGNVTKETATLNVFHSEEYGLYSESMHYTSIPGQIKLNRKPNTTFHFVYGGSSCQNRLYSINEMVIVNLTRKDNAGSFAISNSDPDFDIDECIYARGGTDSCSLCDESIVSNARFGTAINQTVCSQCTQARNECSEQAASGKVTIDYVPAGSYEASMMIINPSKMEIDNPDHAFMSIPLRTVTKAVTIPEQDKNINIQIPDSASIYNEAMRRYADRAGDKQCMERVLGVCVKHESEDMAKAAAFEIASAYVQRSWDFDWRECS
jgi:hypothetical protein